LADNLVEIVKAPDDDEPEAPVEALAEELIEVDEEELECDYNMLCKT